MENKSRRPHPNDYSYASERLRFVIRASGFYTELFARQIGMPDAELLYLVLFDNRPLTPCSWSASAHGFRRSTPGGC